MLLPVACPSMGTGSSKRLSYSFTHHVTRCWRCQGTLPEVQRMLDEIRAADPERYEKHLRPLDPANIPAGDTYNRLIEIGLDHRTGLCDGCLDELSSPFSRALRAFERFAAAWSALT